MVELVDLAWSRETHLGVDLIEEPMDGGCIRPTNTNRQASSSLHRCPITINFTVEHPSQFPVQMS